ncbi:MAG: hypothetical protein HY675_15850 [Chloroflexi bacterium]|nr:hypothetical protein [Chloroflexota bacterium]
MPEWQKAALREADWMESGYGERFTSVPRVESAEAYRYMDDFITTVRDARLRDLLEVAIDGRGAFRRFKDVLAHNPSERERWFQFQADQLKRRILEWLEEEGIEPIEV